MTRSSIGRERTVVVIHHGNQLIIALPSCPLLNRSECLRLSGADSIARLVANGTITQDAARLIELAYEHRGLGRRMIDVTLGRNSFIVPLNEYRLEQSGPTLRACMDVLEQLGLPADAEMAYPEGFLPLELEQAIKQIGRPMRFTTLEELEVMLVS